MYGYGHEYVYGCGYRGWYVAGGARPDGAGPRPPWDQGDVTRWWCHQGVRSVGRWMSGWPLCGVDGWRAGRRAVREGRAAGPRGGQDRVASRSRTNRAVSDGVEPTRTPTASRAAFLASAVPEEPDTIAPAWPMVLPSGAVNPAM